MADTVFTFGYEGLTIDRFVARLVTIGIEAVADVRALPLSRKKGFSKSAFAACLNEVGIEYRHFVALGCPKPIRDRYKIDKDWSAYTVQFLRYLPTQAAVVGELAKLTLEKPTCLVCFEADYTTCHRMFVARDVNARVGQRVVHLTDRTATVDPLARRVA